MQWPLPFLWSSEKWTKHCTLLWEPQRKAEEATWHALPSVQFTVLICMPAGHCTTLRWIYLTICMDWSTLMDSSQSIKFRAVLLAIKPCYRVTESLTVQADAMQFLIILQDTTLLCVRSRNNGLRSRGVSEDQQNHSAVETRVMYHCACIWGLICKKRIEQWLKKCL